MVQALGELSAAAGAVAALDPHLLPAGELVSGLEQLLDLQTRLESIQVRWLAAAEQREAIVDETGRSPRGWLIEEQLRNPREATRKMKLVRELPAYPCVQAAYDAQQITTDHACVILDALASIPPEIRDGAAAALVDRAREVPPFQVAREVDDLLQALGVDKAGDVARERREACRHVSVADTLGGHGSLSGSLTPTLREKLQAALRALSAPGGPEDDRSAAQRRHDSLEQIVDHWLSTADTPAVNGERPRLVVTVSYDALRSRLLDLALLDSGVTISPATARRLACDAEILPVVMGSRGEVLDIGQVTRTWNAATRRAAWLEQQGRCAFPGCRNRCVDLHHLVWWSHGGRTSLDNAAWVCSFHHWLAHDGGWTARRDGPGQFTWTAPDGREIGPPRHPEAA